MTQLTQEQAQYLIDVLSGISVQANNPQAGEVVQKTQDCLATLKVILGEATNPVQEEVKTE